MAQLICKNLTLGYDNRAIQEDLNFSIDAGDYLCIVGENGSGKRACLDCSGPMVPVNLH